MYKRIKKIQLKGGQDSKQAQLRKLIQNFLYCGTLKTTGKKVRYVKSEIDRLITKAKRKSQADSNIIKNLLRNNKLALYCMDTVGPLMKDRVSGYTKLIRLGKRVGDGSDIMQLSWIIDVPPFKIAKPKKEKKVEATEKVQKKEKPEKNNKTKKQ
jgi:large subunit ribosomal protein L17